MKQLIEDLISAMEYHVEQTRPIHSTTVALQAAREALKTMPTPLVCDCNQGQVCHVCDPITPPAHPAPVHGWINPNDKTQRRFLPDIGDKVLFCIGERVYYGHHTGGGFRTGQGVATKYFSTWDCHWMPIPPAHGIK